MKSTFIKGMLAACLGLISTSHAQDLSVLPASSAAIVPGQIGFAGMSAAAISSDASVSDTTKQQIITIGGANFPNAEPNAQTAEQRGDKVFYKQIGLINTTNGQVTEGSTPTWVGELDYEVGYSAFAADGEALYIAGGCNASGHIALVRKISYKDNKAIVETLPDLPETVSYASGAIIRNVEDGKVVRHIFYVIGGQQNADSTECSSKVYALDLLKEEKAWEQLADMPSPRMLAGCTVHSNNTIVLLGGCSLLPDAEGQAVRSYLTSSLCYDTYRQRWSGSMQATGSKAEDDEANKALTDYLEQQLAAKEAELLTQLQQDDKNKGLSPEKLQEKAKGEAKSWNNAGKLTVNELPEALVGMASPLPLIEGKIFVIGGDPGQYYAAQLKGEAPAAHPGQSNKIYSYSIDGKEWSVSDQTLSVGVATLPAVQLDYNILLISGETHPGVRTDAITTIEIKPSMLVQFFQLIAKVADLTPWAAFALLIGAIIFAMKNGFRNKPLAPYVEGKGPGKWAWICVAVLWIVVMLNYADRQLLATLNVSVTNPVPGSGGIKMSQADFGLITSIFLVIYACLSPVGGFLADRFSRKTIIMCSLVVWSLATWSTGMAHDFTTLLIARAAMGVSEAFYIPAALALISDYHRGSTRSMATGLHMSGIYAGQVIAGYGAWVSGDPTNLGWHVAFEVFGAIGVIYGLVVILFLRDPETATDEQLAAAKTADPANAPASTNFTIGEVLRNLFSTKSMYLLIGVVSLSGFANWFIMNWYPRLLQDTYQLSESEAGPMATGPVNIVKYIAVLVAAAIADRWSRSNPNARAYVPAVAFLISGPCVIVAMLPNVGFDFISFSLSVAIGLIAMQGLAQGALDANLMPVLRSQIDERFSATGYGILNLTSVSAGALVAYMGGLLLDWGIPLSNVMIVSGAFIFIAAFCLIAMRSTKTA